MCGSWNIGHDSDFGLFFALLPPQQLQKSKFWKNEKTPRDIIISNRCAIYENHIMFSPWDMEHDRQNIWSLWTIFCPLTSLTTWKIKILNKRKKPLEISFYTSVAKIVIIWYTVPEIWHVKDVVCFSFWAIFCSFTSPPPPPNSPKKQNSQNIIKPGDIIILHICTENYDHIMYSSWDMVHKGQTDSWCPRIFFLIFVAFIGLVIKHAPLI